MTARTIIVALAAAGSAAHAGAQTCDIIALAGGGRHSVAVRGDGLVYTWGENRWGQLGLNSTVDAHLPQAVSDRDISEVVGVAAGGWQTVAVKRDGTVWAWGGNCFGQLGQGTIQPRLVDGAVPVLDGQSGGPLVGMVAVAAGSHHALGLKADGTVVGWGDNSLGQLGIGTPHRLLAAEPIPGLKDVIGIAAGHAHSLAVDGRGRVWSWGSNEAQQLGRSTVGPWDPSPGLVSLPKAPALVKAVGAGANFSLALLAKGEVWAWGDGTYGQLGDGSVLPRGTPLPVLAGGAPLRGIKTVAAGHRHALGLKADGTLWSWGHNGYGQLGNDSMGISECQCSPQAVPVERNGAALSGVSRIAAGAYHSLAWRAGGELLGWGLDDRGQLGDGAVDSTGGWAPGPAGRWDVKVVTANPQSLQCNGCVETLVDLDAGNQFSVGVTGIGQPLAWGVNAQGQLGDGKDLRYGSDVPVAVEGLTGVLLAVAGHRHAAALRSDGTVWIWGDNSAGQLGMGRASPLYLNRPTQVVVAGGGNLDDVIGLAAGGAHTLALKADGTLWSWGLNLDGQLGAPTPAIRYWAEQVEGLGLARVRALGAGSYHSLVVLDNAEIWAWGANDEGQLGDGGRRGRWMAQALQDGGGSTLLGAQVAGGLAHTVVRRADGTVWGCGDNSWGQLDNGGGRRRSSCGPSNWARGYRSRRSVRWQQARITRWWWWAAEARAGRCTPSG